VPVVVQISGGTPALLLVGLPDKAVREADERMRAAMAAMGLALPPRRILINLAPADLLKEGRHFDLPIALAVLAAMDAVPREELHSYVEHGELALDGTLNPVPGVLPAVIGASTHDLGLIGPASQGGEATWAALIEALSRTRPAVSDQSVSWPAGAETAHNRRFCGCPRSPNGRPFIDAIADLRTCWLT